MWHETSALEIREVKNEDLDSIYELEKGCFKDPYPQYLLNQLAEEYPETFVVAKRGTETVGYLAVAHFTNHYHLVSVAVEPSSRRLGIAQRMLSLVEDRLPSGVLRLELRKSNDPALELYRKNGFRETGLVSSYYADGEDAITMEKTIDGKNMNL
ncbi:MAG TPA: ribosomal protein S18-alanine N-acetyltransferase [Candidatus Bathyarchaeia archaeon]|nr:ribosomal protein S18-alanine N-acetyltransferase [Candidatus Bathyarchaeia archaeon]